MTYLQTLQNNGLSVEVVRSGFDQAHRARGAYPVFIFEYGDWRVYDGSHCSM